MNDIRVYTLAGLHDAAKDKRSITVPSSRTYEGPISAAFMMNLPGAILLRLFKDGMYLYEKPKKEGAA